MKGHIMTKRKSYKLDELLSQCDPEAPKPSELKAWDDTTTVGLEQDVMGDQVDIRQAVLVFAEKLRGQYEATQLILFGSRARGDYHTESDADVAVILPGNPGDFVETKLAMADLAFDTLLEMGVLIQAFPVWESEWAHPASYSNPDILRNIAREGIIIWSSSQS
ncbi:antitoxin ChpS [Marinobacter persicus]|uniref:Antitoxin ChpS n=2 Tax=Marinobacter persicus TaxID=930118 RepID=A0A2S6G2A4_9GAMM|nr:antitoxin ChpS [Marinobacter persicus]PPK51583.1 antitoxin ChpS [Marinobacter persicus]PPK56030.1 antitoxin ChpS [Marinobacter persicus]